MTVQRMLTALILMFGLAVPAVAQSVTTDYDRNANFSQYRTYSWGKIEVKNVLWVDRIHAAVNSALASKGWTQVATEGDVVVTASEVTSQHSTVESTYNGFESWSGHDYVEKQYRVGSLVVNLADNHTKKLFWRGTTSDTLSKKSEKNIKNLDDGVQKMFEHFPPESKN